MSVSLPREDVLFWVDTPDERPCPPLTGEATAAVAVVGGGFAGLSAAYHLARERPGPDVVLLEAARVGCGASGRNTGMLGPRVGGMLGDLVRKFGEAEGRRLYQFSLDAVLQVKELIRAEGLACELEDTAQVKAAVTAARRRRCGRRRGCWRSSASRPRCTTSRRWRRSLPCPTGRGCAIR